MPSVVEPSEGVEKPVVRIVNHRVFWVPWVLSFLLDQQTRPFLGVFLVFVLLWFFTENLDPVFRVTGDFVLVHGPDRLVDVVHVEHGALLSDYFGGVLEGFFVEIAGDLRLAKDNSSLGGNDPDVPFLLLAAFVEQPLTGFHDVVMVESVGSSTLLDGEISAKTFEDLSDGVLVDGFFLDLDFP